ncbi:MULTISPECIES: hypothetical protein [unclassified Coleofasciculus]|uniref:ATPase, T2SS/T4P/T4SS family n=1 Tax=unclassified Coleofasciculus TaxID=2692782 RepID=UPI001881DA03|nr:MULTISPECIES: hypothetical protein [unclassified Coleofasciculus]MBE9124666.1 hypothetical protein [Coleofasciculus sp. LEGE 07081]MBE9146993.1 hypothetical protein [Coleofasciculus sp. LEGE 07092]
MLPSPRDPERADTSAQSTPSPSQASELSEVDTEQMFRLIDTILPFEACLYYQFLPLALEGKYLKLGIVDPQDASALDYVRHILAYLHCSFKTERIAAKTHQSMLSAYLNHVHTTSSAEESPSLKKNPKNNTPRSEQPTFILEEPSLADENLNPPPSSSNTTTPSTAIPKPPLPLPKNLPFVSSHSSSQDTPADKAPPFSKPLPLGESPAPLEVEALYRDHPIEFIATLAPQELLQELLGRVLERGIGRLYFERQSDAGRILWSQDGVLQSILERLSLSVFESVIIELKQVVTFPLLPVNQPQQVEIERVYRQECLLLRLRVMPGTYGEEATLQVLRGVALKFYQRQKLERLSQEALNLAEQLQRKLNEIRDRSCRYSLTMEGLPALKQRLKGVEQQLEAIAKLPIKATEK